MTAEMSISETWAGFYTSTTQSSSVDRITDAHCLSAILKAQNQFKIPDNLLLSIGIQEAGRAHDDGVTVWPWAVNAEGKGIFFRSREQAIGWVRSQLAQGVKSIDVGCMQINLYWHADAFDSLEEAFDPIANATYAARFLTELRQREGSWWQAAGSYHSKTPVLQSKYLASLKRNQAVAATQFEKIASRAQAADLRPRVGAASDNSQLQPPVLWGDDTDETEKYSIYSRRPLSPVLPPFRDAF
jgi:hypothetical protein